MEGKWGLVFCLLGFILGLLLGLSKSDPTSLNGLVNGLIGWAWVDFYTRVLHKTCLKCKRVYKCLTQLSQELKDLFHGKMEYEKKIYDERGAMMESSNEEDEEEVHE